VAVAASSEASEAAPRRYQLGRFQVDAASLSIRIDGEDCGAEAMQVRTLLALIEAHPGVVSKDALIEQVWGGRYVTDAAVHKTISLLRRLLTDRGGEELIRTRHRLGYQLLVEPRVLADGEAGIGEVAAEPPSPRPLRRQRWLPSATVALLATVLVLSAVGLLLHWREPPPPLIPVAELTLPARAVPELDGFDNEALLKLSRDALPADPDLAQAAAGALLARIDEAGEPALYGQALMQLGQAAYQRGELVEALSLFERSLPTLRRANEPSPLALALQRAGAARVDLGIEPELAQAAYDEALETLQRIGDRKSEAQLRYNRALLATRQGRLDRARDEASKLESLAAALGESELQARALLQLADIALRAGDADAVIRFEAALDAATNAGLPLLAGAAAQRLGRLAGQAGDYPRERGWLDAARRHLAAAGSGSQLPVIDYSIGASFEREGLLDDAAQAYRAALDALPAEPARPIRVDLQVNLARIALTMGRGDEAETWLASAERDARLSGSPAALASVRINQGFRELQTGGSAVAALAAANEVADLIDGSENWDLERNLHTLSGLALIANERHLEAESRIRSLREKALARQDSMSLAQADYLESVSLFLRGDFFGGHAAHRRAIGVASIPGSAAVEPEAQRMQAVPGSTDAPATHRWLLGGLVAGLLTGWLLGRLWRTGRVA